MKKFKIIIEGRNFLIHIEKFSKKMGFYTTRFVEAEDESKAESIALDLIRAELNERDIVLNDFMNPPMLYIEKNEEVLSYNKKEINGKGFTWYPEE